LTAGCQLTPKERAGEELRTLHLAVLSGGMSYRPANDPERSGSSIQRGSGAPLTWPRKSSTYRCTWRLRWTSPGNVCRLNTVAHQKLVANPFYYHRYP
jgi:hypothetical protein